MPCRVFGSRRAQHFQLQVRDLDRALSFTRPVTAPRQKLEAFPLIGWRWLCARTRVALQKKDRQAFAATPDMQPRAR
jgi:hypothetical protein